MAEARAAAEKAAAERVAAERAAAEAKARAEQEVLAARETAAREAAARGAQPIAAAAPQGGAGPIAAFRGQIELPSFGALVSRTLSLRPR